MNPHFESERRHQIPGPICELANNSALVNHICQAYIRGEIITFEEMLCQLVINTHRNWEKMNADYLQYRMNFPAPIFTQPISPLKKET